MSDGDLIEIEVEVVAETPKAMLVNDGSRTGAKRLETPDFPAFFAPLRPIVSGRAACNKPLIVNRDQFFSGGKDLTTRHSCSLPLMIAHEPGLHRKPEGK